MEADFSHTLYHNDLSALALGSFQFGAALGEADGGLFAPVNHLHGTYGTYATYGTDEVPESHRSYESHKSHPIFEVIERGTGKYIEVRAPSNAARIILAGSPEWTDYRLRAVVTPLDPDGTDALGGICGIVARFADPLNYVAVVLDRDRHVKLLQRIDSVFHIIESKALEFCLGQSLTLSLTLTGNQAHATAGPYSGPTHLKGTLATGGNLAARGRAGYIADVPARFGPFTVECSSAEAARLQQCASAAAAALTKKRAPFPKMKLDRTVPLHGLVNGRTIRIVDINGDGRPEIVLAQSSPAVAEKYSLTRLTCLSVLDLNGKLLWQAGIPDESAPSYSGDLPFQVHDLYGDGGKVVVCAFGFDIQVRDGKSGKVLFSKETPGTVPVGADFKEVSSSFGAPWGDESLNMDVAAIAFCRTLGNGSREIIVKDDFHHLAVLDALSDPPLNPLIRHRGNHGHFPWIGDVNGDGADEILAGCSLLGAEGKRLGQFSLSDHPCAVAVLDPATPGGLHPQIIAAAGNDGLLLFSLSSSGKLQLAQQFKRVDAAPAGRLSIAKFRGDLPGVQILTSSSWDTPGLLRLHDAAGKLLWSKQFAAPGLVAQPVNWTGDNVELILASMAPGSGLLDGQGEFVVEAPGKTPFTYCDTTTAFSADGRDAIAAWDAKELAIHVADNAPLKKECYKPTRPGLENSSNHRAQISLPPGYK